MNFRSEINEIIPNYDPQNVINTDQTGFKYEVYSNRTLSHYKERCTVAALNSPSNKASHSYTVQYIISLSGEIIGDAFVCLQAIFYIHVYYALILEIHFSKIINICKFRKSTEVSDHKWNLLYFLPLT